MKVMKQLAMVAAVTAFSVAGASAALLNYEIGSGSTVTGDALTDPGLVIQYAFDAGLVGHSFTLDDGQETTFNFFDIWTQEDYAHADDWVSQSISATLDFSVPDVDGTVGGASVAFYALFEGTEGRVTWSSPAIVTVAGRQFQVSLSDEEFNGSGFMGGWSLNPGPGAGATVQATVKQIWGNQGGTHQVPDGGATLALLGMGLAGLAFLRRK